MRDKYNLNTLPLGMSEDNDGRYWYFWEKNEVMFYLGTDILIQISI